MIKINIDNIEIIKNNHREYIKNNVEDKINSYNMFNSDKIDIANFISNILNINLYEITLEKLEIESLKSIIEEYNRIKDKHILEHIEEQKMKEILHELNEYLQYIEGSNGKIKGIIEERKNKWKDLCSLVCNISNHKIKIEKFYKNEINFNSKEKIKSDLKRLIKFINESINPNYKMEEIIKYIFDYEKFSGNNDVWNRHKIIYLMGVDVCPYCNRNYITNYLDNDVEKTTADLDHFYCQSKYPYLGLSIYNFIPSCQVCNSRFKIAKDFIKDEHILPYKEGFDKDAFFRTKLNKDSTLDYILGLDLNFDIEIKINTNDEYKKNKIKNSIDTFKLNQLYAREKEYVNEVIKKSHIYNNEEIIKLSNIEGLFESKQEIKKFIFGMDMKEESLHKKPLSKLTLDIFEEFNI